MQKSTSKHCSEHDNVYNWLSTEYLLGMFWTFVRLFDSHDIPLKLLLHLLSSDNKSESYKVSNFFSRLNCGTEHPRLKTLKYP